MYNLTNLLGELNNLLSKYRYKPIDSGEMIRLAENEDEITLWIPSKYKNKNIVLLYTTE